MPAPIRSLTLAATLIMLARPVAGAQQTSPPSPPSASPPGRVFSPAPPTFPAPSVPGTRDFRNLTAFGESMGALGDSLQRLGDRLGEVEARAQPHPTARDRATIDSVKRAMDQIVRRMSHGSHWGQWRDAVRQARDAAREAAREAVRQAHTAPMVAGGSTHRGAVAEIIDRVRRDPEAVALPPTDSFSVGGLTVPAGTQRAGMAAAVNGNLDVFGAVAGDAIAVAGDVNVHSGGHVSGKAFAAGGEVHVDSGGSVDGEVRSLQGDFGPFPAVAGHALASTSSRWHSVKVAIAAFAMLLVLGIGVLTFAEEQLDNVTATLADHFGRSAWYGIVGEIALAPLLLALVIALCITIVGILVLPFAVVGYTALAVGAGTLGFMAVAEATGTALLRSQSQASLSPRGAQLRAIVTGISIYGGVWVLTAIVGTDSGMGIAVRVLALVVGGVAVTVGFGAVLLWRFDVRRARRLTGVTADTPINEALWQTPTPVAGVAAARRPAPTATPTSGGTT
jgi:hypothetical protein